MATIKYQELKRRYDLDGANQTVRHLTEAIQAKQLKAEDFSLKQLAEALVPDGREWVRMMDPRQAGGVQILEAGDAVDSTAFSNITGQIVYSAMMDSYEQEAFVITPLFNNVPTRLDGEKIPGIGKLDEDDLEVHEGMPYPRVGLGEDYIETPSTTKRGLIVPVTKEAIFFDRTNLVLSRAGEVGELLGLRKEIRCCDVFVGTTNNHNWKGTAYNTYYLTGAHPLALGAGGWCNDLAANELVDWTDVDAAEQLFVDILDPNTGQPVLVNAVEVLVMPAYRHAAARVFNATEIRYPGASAAATTTIAANPLANYKLESSRQVYRRVLAGVETTAAKAKKYWYMGDFKKAFAYMENWPITVTQAPANAEAEFEQDIVVQFKASERGVAAVMNPRFVVRCYDT